MTGQNNKMRGTGTWVIIGAMVLALWLMRYFYRAPSGSDDDCVLVFVRSMHGRVTGTRFNHLTGNFVAEIKTDKGPVKIQKWYVDSPEKYIEKGDSIAKDTNSMDISVFKPDTSIYFDLKGFSDCSSAPGR